MLFPSQECFLSRNLHDSLMIPHYFRHGSNVTSIHLNMDLAVVTKQNIAMILKRWKIEIYLSFTILVVLDCYHCSIVLDNQTSLIMLLSHPQSAASVLKPRTATTSATMFGSQTLGEKKRQGEGKLSRTHRFS